MDVNTGLGRHPADPGAYTPLTRENIRQQLPLLMGQLFSLRLVDLAAWRSTMARLYAPDAVFDYPATVMRGRDDILRFWTAFLVLRALQWLDVHNLQTPRMVFDPERLQALLELEAHHNWGWLRWMDWAAAAAGFIKPGQRLTLWKVWSVQVLDFEETPSGELSISHQTELIDQFVLFGCLIAGAVLVKPPRGTLLAALLLLLRTAARWVISANVALLEAALGAVGVRLA